MELLSSRPTTHVGSEAQQSHLFKHHHLCINTRGLFLIWTHSSHHISLSLLCRKESLLYCAEKGLSLTHVKPEVAETKAATAEVKIDLRGLEDLLI